ncbi:MAG: GNAT family N-acetyltransferase [Dysgonamonadaceae bacterium]|jgi:N-acetylglutamate synthase-like GNAT family acetyltransferase|nr:GNAT family N-acetyltransferase [Dysgonamonadaceae bacterium]
MIADDFNVTIEDWRIFCDGGCLEYAMEEGDSAEIMSIDVHWKRQGIGTELVKTFENLAKSQGYKLVCVPVSLSSEAILFWLSMGYILSDKRDKRKMNKILMSDNYNSCDDGQGVLAMEKQIITLT